MIRRMRARFTPAAVVAVGLALLILAAYAPLWKNGFVEFDDDVYVTENPWVAGGLSGRAVAWAFTSIYAFNWHPLTWLSHLADVSLYGLDPRGHHFTSLLIHLANSILVFLVLAAMTGSRWRSALVAAIFAVHPLHVESVAWAAERKDVLAGFFGLLALGAYRRYLARPGARRYLPVLLCLILGLLSKPVLVTLPFVLLLLDYWPLNRFSPGRIGAARTRRTAACLLGEKLPLMLAVAASSVVTYLVQRRTGAMETAETFPLAGRAANAAMSYLAYLRQSAWPVGLAYFYPHRGLGGGWGKPLLAGLTLAAVTFLVWRARRRPSLAVGWLWFLGSLVPVIGLVQVGTQGMADRYMYLPLLALAVAVAWGLPEPVLPAGRWAAVVAAPLLLVALASLTARQTGYWRDDLSLSGHALRVTKDNWMALNDYGALLARRGRTDEAMRYYRESVRIKPDYSRALFNLGLALEEKGEWPEAVQRLTEAVRSDPQLEEARRELAKATNNLGVALARRGEWEEARSRFLEAVRLQPEFFEARLNLAGALDQADRFAEAIDHYRRALAQRPDLAAVRDALATDLLRVGRRREAIGQYREALRIQPGLSVAREHLRRAQEGPPP